MTTELEVGLYIFILAGFLGYHVITRVPPLLHTPLMSATNAISGISLIGSLVVTGAGYNPLSTILGTIAVACSSTNVVGGFLITDRMLKMFKKGGEEGAAERRRERAMLTVFAVLVTLVILSLYAFSVSSGEAEARSALAAHALRYFYILSAFL